MGDVETRRVMVKGPELGYTLEMWYSYDSDGEILYPLSGW